MPVGFIYKIGLPIQGELTYVSLDPSKTLEKYKSVEFGGCVGHVVNLRAEGTLSLSLKMSPLHEMTFDLFTTLIFACC